MRTKGTLKRGPTAALSVLILVLVVVLFFAGRSVPTRSAPPPHVLPTGIAELARGIETPQGLSRVAGASIVSEGQPSNLRLPPGWTSSSRGGRLVFAHLADGVLANSSRYLVTEFFLFNDSPLDVAGTLYFYDDAGRSLTVQMGGEMSDRFPVSLASGQFLHLRTDGQGAIKAGWALLLTDQPIAGTSAFSIRKGASTVITDVGVGESLLQKEFTIFAQTKGDVDTGVALANPHETPLDLRFELRRANGSTAATATRSVPPMGHLALFVTELFKKVSSIDNFEGSIVITADQSFGGITLRTTGLLWTSVPMVPLWDPNDWNTRLFFPQVADGRDTGIQVKTTVVLFNTGPERATGTVDFFESDGSPMRVKIGGVTASSFDYDLRSRGVRKLATAGNGAVKVGWGRVNMNEAIAAAAIFHIYTDTGRLMAEVGVVPPLQEGGQFNVIADSTGPMRTGLALVNTSEEGEDADVNIALIGTDREVVSTTSVSLLAGQQQALFFDQLFGDVPSIDEFDGGAVVLGGEDVLGMTLRQVGLLTTSLPSLLPVHGFAATSLFDVAQNVAGTKPAVRWRIEQPGTDLALEKMEVSVPEMGVDLSEIEIGDPIAFGTYLVSAGQGLLRLGGLVEFVVTAKGSLEFDVLASGPFISPLTQLFSGRLEGRSNRNLKLTLGPTETLNGEWNQGILFELDLMFRPGLFVAPRNAKTIEITTTATSASSKLLESDVAVVRTMTRPQEFVSMPSGRGRVFSVEPLYYTPGQSVRILGDRFGGDPTAGFRTRGGNVALLQPATVEAGVLDVDVPPYIEPGAIWISRELVAGNGHYFPSLFAPVAEVSRSSQEAVPSVPFQFLISLDEAQLGVQEFTLDLLSVDRTLSGLSVGNVVGSAHTVGGTQAGAEVHYDMMVESSTAARLELEIVEEGDGDPVARMTITKIAEPPGLRFTYVPIDYTEFPAVNGFPVQMEFQFSNLPITLPPEGEASTWTAYIVSVPAALSGKESGLTAVLSN